ncbi:MAG: aminopeptidase P family protein [Desulfobacterales bacterium]
MTNAKESHKRRLGQVRRELKSLSVEALLILIQENRRYLCGYTGEDGQFDESAGVLVITKDRAVLATDSRYDIQAERETFGVEVVRYPKGWVHDLPGILKEMGIRSLGFESARMSVLQHQKLASNISAAEMAVDLVPVDGVVERLRICKDEIETEITRRSLATAETAFDRLRPKIRRGITEIELAWLLEQELKAAGAEGPSFPIIVAAGPNSALPHAVPGPRTIHRGEPILFDWGARLEGYCSDISRTFILGPADSTFRKVYDVVREAQAKAIEAIRPGMPCREIDAVARKIINATEFNGRFGHSLGHGTGLAIHESPKLSPTSDDILEPGMIVTVEPGIYLPEWGGVRLEHQVLVTANGAEILNGMELDSGELPEG